MQKELEREGFGIIWTPPYLPDVQPIELFWAGGKNYAADQFVNKRSMKSTVADLRDGWYGNLYPAISPDGLEIVPFPLMIRGNSRILKRPVKCGSLVQKVIREADRIILETPGISGTIAGGVTITAKFANLVPSAIDTTIAWTLGDAMDSVAGKGGG